MQIRAIKRCVTSGGRLEPGQVAEVSHADASVLIRLGQAEEVSDEAIAEPDPPITNPPPPDVPDDDDDPEDE